jgi:electron transport complex protein RnfC
VTKIETNFFLPDGRQTTAVIIESDSAAESDYAYLQNEYSSLGRIIKAGIHDASSTTRPLMSIIQQARTSRIKTLIVHALDELLLTGCKSFLLAYHAQAVLQGVQTLLRLTGAQEAVIAVYSPVYNRLDIQSLSQDNVRIMPVAAKHPQHMDQLLVKAVSGEEYPAGDTPENLGLSIISAETAFALQHCLNECQPQLEKFVTVSGSGLSSHKNLLVNIGTPLEQVLQYAGLNPQEVAKVVAGGMLTGQAVSSLEMPVSKDMTQIIALDKDHLYTPITDVCMKCGYCVQSCPMRLMPFLISGYSESGHYELAAKNDIFSCIECGCCAYVCPAKIPMVQWIQLGKSMLNAQRSQEDV